MKKSPQITHLETLLETPSIKSLRRTLSKLEHPNPVTDDDHFINQEIVQISASQTVERAHYYVRRLIKALTEIRTHPHNDINLNRWKAYTHLNTDSLWLYDRRDQSDMHKGWYWGNYIPQIPNQFIQRYTKKGDWVLDTFCGSGTTLIECRKLGRNGLATELLPNVIDHANATLNECDNPENITTHIEQADCTRLDYANWLPQFGTKHVQLVLCHPPYWDIIKFSDDPKDLSNAKTLRAFKMRIRRMIRNVHEILEPGRYLAFVIGDKYEKGEWIPLGFECMELIRELGFSLKSIVVKNFDQTKGKQQQEELWRFRAISSGFFVFKHEYIFVFQKK